MKVDPSPTGAEARTAQIAQIESTLGDALKMVSRLLEDASDAAIDQASYHLGETCRAIHHALIALTESLGTMAETNQQADD